MEFLLVPPQIERPKSHRRRLQWKAAWDDYIGYWVENPLLPWTSAQYAYPDVVTAENPHGGEKDHTSKKTAIGGWTHFFANAIAIASVDRWDALWLHLLAFTYEEIIWFYEWLAPWPFGIGISGVLGMQAGYLVYMSIMGRGNWLTWVGGFSTLIVYLEMYFTDEQSVLGNISHGAHLGGLAYGAMFGLLLDYVRRPTKGVALFRKYPGWWTLGIIACTMGLEPILKSRFPTTIKQSLKPALLVRRV